MAAATSPAANAGVRIPLEQLIESPTNPRKTWGDLRELAETIGKLGVLQPLLVRPLPDPLGTDEAPRFEIVFGHRRYRASKLAKLEDVPCNVRDLSDRDALEAQVVENNQRTDLHELEEAEGYEQLHELHAMGVDEIAAKVGKSRAYVYARMKLLALCPAARKAFYEGKLTSSTALYVARIPDAKLQAEAVKAIGPRRADEDALSAREAFRVITGRFMLRLADAPFDRGDAALVPKAGPYTSCPKRTGNQKELFADVKSADVCIDPKCYRSKVDAVWTKRTAAAKEEGVAVLSGTAAKKAFYANGQLLYNSGFVDLDAKTYVGRGERTYRSLLKGSKAEVTIARDPEGKIRELVSKGAAAAAERKVRKQEPSESTEREKKWREEQARASSKRKLEELVDELAIAEVARKVERKKLADVKYFRMVLGLLLEGDALMFGIADKIATRHGLGVPENEAAGVEHELATRLAKTTEPVLRSMLLELALGGVHGRELDAILAEYKVDKAKLRKQAAAEAKVAKSASKPTKRKTAPTPGTCSECGCTEVAACETDEGPCSWANAAQTLCSACAP